MGKVIVLRISDHDGAELNGIKPSSTDEVAEALRKVRVENSDASISIEASDSTHYEPIGKAIYGSHRAGFSGEQFRILIKGRPWEGWGQSHAASG